MNKSCLIIIIFVVVVLLILAIVAGCMSWNSILLHEKKTYSQIGQDIKVLDFFNHKKHGYFIEAGANDGITLSNTYLLEKDYDWKGICIEPVQTQFKKLQKNRKSINLPYALYNTNDEIVTIMDNPEDGGMLSGIKDDIDGGEYHKKVLKNKELTAKTKTLTTILDEVGAPPEIDYLSLDTEGSELKILEGIDFSKYVFNYINIEHNYSEPRRTQMRELLERNNYKYVGQNQFDDIYIYKNQDNFGKRDGRS